MKNIAPTLVTSCTALPPEGAVPPQGGLSAELAPTLVTSCSALPPEGAVPPQGGLSAELAPTLGERLHGSEAPSAWVQRWSHLVPAAGRVLDVACGQGRHAYWFYKRNHPLTLVDRAKAAIESIAIPAESCEVVVADIETGPWPFAGRQFDAVIVTNYLWRPLLPTLLASIAPGGVLIYETFAQGNETVGKPSRPDFLLRPGELLALCRDLRVVAFEDGYQEAPARFIQRIAAVREVSSPASAVRYVLHEARQPLA